MSDNMSWCDPNIRIFLAVYKELQLLRNMQADFHGGPPQDVAQHILEFYDKDRVKRILGVKP